VERAKPTPNPVRAGRKFELDEHRYPHRATSARGGDRFW